VASTAAVTQGRALLAALAGLTAFDCDDIGEVMAVAADPRACAGALMLASKLAAEVDRLGGDSMALRDRIYGQASALAYSA
jgi:hypothetical protein